MTDIQSLLATWDAKFRDHPDGAELPPHHPHCLGCGPDNPHGHHLLVRRRGDGVVATHVFDERHVGAPGIAHGGAVATVLDDLLGFLLYLTGQPAVTRSLTIEYLSPVLFGVQYEIAGKALETEGRKRSVEAVVVDPQQRIVARATAVFVAVDVAHFEQASSAE